MYVRGYGTAGGVRALEYYTDRVQVGRFPRSLQVNHWWAIFSLRIDLIRMYGLPGAAAASSWSRKLRGPAHEAALRVTDHDGDWLEGSLLS